MEIPGEIGYSAEFETTYLNYIRKDPNSPVINLDAAFQCPGDRFRNAISLCAGISDICYIDITKDRSVFLRANDENSNLDRKSTRLNSSHLKLSRMPSSA